jgi:Trypsin-co-occurring domain 2
MRRPEGADADIRYVPKSVEVELSIEISKEAETKETGALQSIVSLQGPGRPDSQNTHTVKLTLEPVDFSGRTAVIASSVIPKR